jgi:two-component system, OmpR family, alkaline phosphatase synthesis response regulator PhoP
MKKRILVVEDEQSLRQMIAFNLEAEGYEVVALGDGKKAIEIMPGINRFALVVLDVMMPFVSGLDVCVEIRKNSQVPILFLSAKGTSADRIAGLKLGANDYLPKPFDLEELLLRVSVLAGKSESLDEAQDLKIGDFEVNFRTYQVMLNGIELAQLTKREVALLQLFARHAHEVVARDKILDEIWGVDQFPTTRTIDNYILNFRKIFEKDAKNPVLFHSIRGVGYKFTP